MERGLSFNRSQIFKRTVGEKIHQQNRKKKQLRSLKKGMIKKKRDLFLIHTPYAIHSPSSIIQNSIIFPFPSPSAAVPATIYSAVNIRARYSIIPPHSHSLYQSIHGPMPHFGDSSGVSRYFFQSMGLLRDGIEG